MSSLSSCEIQESDLLILLVGQTGTGKSKFINTAVKKNVMKENGNLATSSDLQVQHTICTRPRPRDTEPPLRVVFVDTPGLNGTLTEDSDVARNIADWIKNQCYENMKFAILYLVEAKQTGLPLLHDLRKHSASRDITLVVGTKFELESGNTKGPSRDMDHNNTHESAWSIVDRIQRHTCAGKAFEVAEFFRKFTTEPPKKRSPGFLRKLFSFLFNKS